MLITCILYISNSKKHQSDWNAYLVSLMWISTSVMNGMKQQLRQKKTRQIKMSTKLLNSSSERTCKKWFTKFDDAKLNRKKAMQNAKYFRWLYKMLVHDSFSLLRHISFFLICKIGIFIIIMIITVIDSMFGIENYQNASYYAMMNPLVIETVFSSSAQLFPMCCICIFYFTFISFGSQSNVKINV